ncbi:MAG TPA: ECF-type sigma factor [Thermoanaerobaculia bacterium]|nr:ECF-type sigma factor [Thermoanaerobaculia bacterium]
MPSPDGDPRAVAPSDVTRLLLAWGRGDSGALEKLMPLVYPELRRLAARYLRRERSGGSFQSAAVVHEAYLRLIDQKNVRWKNRAHFFGVAAQAMRRILIDHARRRSAKKRAGRQANLSLDVEPRVEPRSVDLIALDHALSRLAAMNADQARLVELRYFGGLTTQETAEVMGCSTAKVERDWRAARIWLRRELTGEPA